MEIVKTLDGLIAGFGFFYGIFYAFNREWNKATFFMALSISCEIGYRMSKN